MSIKYIIVSMLALVAGGSFVLIYQDVKYRLNKNFNEDDLRFAIFEIDGKEYPLPITIIEGITTLSTALDILGEKLVKKQSKNLKHKKTTDDYVQDAILEAKYILHNKNISEHNNKN